MTDDRATSGPTVPAEMSSPAGDEAWLDPRRWWTLSILVTTVVLSAIDTSVLNVAIPTILRDLHTTVPSLEWVITGYSLTFAALLMIGGRLGDIHGHRRLFTIGIALFGTGSLIAALAPSVGVLILGEAIIEGIGAALMVPATLALLSTTFKGRERATAFAVWGATIGAAVAFGPLLGGFLTTNYSWRWAFGINVVVAPLAIIGALLFIPRGVRGARTPIDLPGAAMIAAGTFLLVFALSQGSTYGWLSPIEAFTIESTTIWPVSAPISIAPAAFLLSVLIIAGFVLFERRKERQGNHPLFEFSQLRFKTFRYGLVTNMLLALGQLGLVFALALFLQGAVHLTALQNGLWLLPMGLAVMAGAQTGGRLTRRFTPTTIARVGLAIQSIALFAIAWAIEPGITFSRLAPGLILFGIGIGLASSQLTGVVLSEVSADKSGVASGANSTVRQLGAALGAAIVASIITVRTVSHALAAIPSSRMSRVAQTQLASAVRARGANVSVPPGFSPTDAATAHHVLTSALATGARWALLFDGIAVGLGALLSLLIPRKMLASARSSKEVLQPFDDLEPASSDPLENLGQPSR